MSGMGGSTSSYATAGIALGVSGALKLHHHDKMEIISVGITTEILKIHMKLCRYAMGLFVIPSQAQHHGI
jgi:hypothetical protein